MKKQICIINNKNKNIGHIKKITGFTDPSVAVLANRHIYTENDIRTFLNPSFKNIKEPYSLIHMKKAVERIYSAITTGEDILIFGDYDVDGITSTALLINFFNDIKKPVSFRIPHRIHEGYSLKYSDIEEISKNSQKPLIITVDCGTSSHEAIEHANSKGIDVIITDHHESTGNLPEAYACINPKNPECTSGLNHLAGVGVAFYVIIALRKYLREKNFFSKQGIREPNLSTYSDLVALGTIADIVPLKKENRVFAANGLNRISKRCRSGLNSLIHECEINRNTIESDDIGFRLAPRINAAGRMGDAAIAVELLTSTNDTVSDQIAYSLNSYNKHRKQTESDIYEEITDYLENNPQMLEKKSIILAKSGWHQGVIGIVASKLKEKYQKPVIIMSKQDGFAKASARSIDGLDIYHTLLECSDYLEYFGGHAMAAGLTIRTEKIKPFKDKFEEIVQATTTPDIFIPELRVDYNLKFNDISSELLNELELFKPYGCLNPEPLFVSEDIFVSSSMLLKGLHRKMTLRQGDEKTSRGISAIQFNSSPDDIKKSNFKKIVYKLSWNRWRGNKTHQIMIVDMFS